jgi:hypothetical protein
MMQRIFANGFMVAVCNPIIINYLRRQGVHWPSLPPVFAEYLFAKAQRF